MNNQAPIKEPAWNGEDGAAWPRAWAQWFIQVWLGLSGWKRTFNKTVVIDFANVLANTQSAASTVAITGVRQGDAVLVTPLADMVGIVYKGIVTANDTVSIFACNFTAGAVNPASTTFRIIVFQN